MELSVGDVVVVPALGPGVVRAHDTVEVGAIEVGAWRIELGGDRGTLFVPDGRCGEGGLRVPLAAERVPRLYETMATQSAPTHRRNWNQRRRRYEQMLHSNSPTVLAELIGELSLVQKAKAEKNQKLSFGERRLLEKVRDLLAREVATATGVTPDDVHDRMDTVLEAA